jgi:hypothetical protein
MCAYTSMCAGVHTHRHTQTHARARARAHTDTRAPAHACADAYPCMDRVVDGLVTFSSDSQNYMSACYCATKHRQSSDNKRVIVRFFSHQQQAKNPERGQSPLRYSSLAQILLVVIGNSMWCLKMKLEVEKKTRNKSIK